MAINASASFTTLTSGGSSVSSGYSVKIASLNLTTRRVTLSFASALPSTAKSTVGLAAGETKNIDLNGDGVNDIKVKFSNIIVNKASVTLTNILAAEQLTALGLKVGEVIKSSAGVDLYAIGADGLKHRFVNPSVLKSWYFKATSPQGVPDWSKAATKVVAPATFNAVAVGRDVIVRPGTLLIQFGRGTAIYAVGPKAELYKISNPDAAKRLYGSSWGSKVVVFPVNYNNSGRYGPVAGTLSAASKYPDGSLVKFPGSNTTYVIYNGQKKAITNSGFTANSLQDVFVRTAPAGLSADAYATITTAITAKDHILTSQVVVPALTP